MSISKFLLYMNVLSFFLAGEICSPYGQISTRENLYTAYKNEVSGERYCSSTKPSQVLNVRMSKIKCVLQCVATKCAGVNWKEPGTCEIFFSEPNEFSTVGSCTYLRPGMHYKDITCATQLLFSTQFLCQAIYVPREPRRDPSSSMNMAYISDTPRNRTHNLFRPKRESIPLGHSYIITIMLFLFSFSLCRVVIYLFLMIW